MVTPTRPTKPATDHQIQLLEGAREFFPALITEMDAALSDIQFETISLIAPARAPTWPRR